MKKRTYYTLTKQFVLVQGDRWHLAGPEDQIPCISALMTATRRRTFELQIHLD